MQPAGIFQNKIFCQRGYFSTQHSISEDISVQNILSVGILQYKTCKSAGIFQYKIFSQRGYFSTKHAGQRGYFSTKYSVSGDISVQNMQVSGISVQNIQSLVLIK
jgi:hypothetical protein